jgi:hypothetical protein
MNTIERHKLTVRKEGKLNTPWDKYYLFSLIRNCPDRKIKSPFILEGGVNYFILKLESLGLKTLWSCEGHPGGFYITFKAPYKIAKEISYISKGCGVELSISNLIKNFNVNMNLNNRESWMNNCWNLRLLPHGDSYECRNSILRELSIEWEKHL